MRKAVVILLGLIFLGPHKGQAIGSKVWRQWIHQASQMSNPKQRDQALWRLGLKGILYQRNKDAERILKFLLKSPFLSQDEVHLNLGRLYYQERRFKKAIQEYQKVPLLSEFWLEAKEEMAWAYLKIGKPDRALSQLETLLTPYFSSLVQPEAYYLASLIHLKTCNYEGVFKVSAQFKKAYKKRIRHLEQIRRGELSKTQKDLIFKNSSFNFETVGAQAYELPSLFYKDTLFLKSLRQFHKNPSVHKVQKVIQRLQALAQRDLKAIKDTIHLLQVVEAEVIQRLYGGPKAVMQATRGPQPRKGQLVFPVDPKEVWIDELDSYQVNTSSCPYYKKVGRL
ncbi:MAG: hypothetical protein D6797_00215 [Bdellovibrio sp.]|nr:MAG: hypothetical protein D6797_00215 [Bdellovibrio sp.]